MGFIGGWELYTDISVYKSTIPTTTSKVSRASGVGVFRRAIRDVMAAGVSPCRTSSKPLLSEASPVRRLVGASSFGTLVCRESGGFRGDGVATRLSGVGAGNLAIYVAGGFKS